MGICRGQVGARAQKSGKIAAINARSHDTKYAQSGWCKYQSQQELDSAFNVLADDLLSAKDKYQETRELDEQIFGEDFEAWLLEEPDNCG